MCSAFSAWDLGLVYIRPYSLGILVSVWNTTHLSLIQLNYLHAMQSGGYVYFMSNRRCVSMPSAETASLQAKSPSKQIILENVRVLHLSKSSEVN